MYCIYLRKSRADLELEAQGHGDTLARHRATLTRYASEHGLIVGEIYQEIVSGDTIAARPQMQRLLRDVSDGKWEGVLVTEIERLSRGDSVDQSIVAQTFASTGALIVTPLKTYDLANDSDMDFLEFGLFMSRRELKTIKRRMQAGRVASAREGNWQSPKAPFGYERVHNEHGRGWTLRPHPIDADTYRLMVDLYLHGGENGEGLGSTSIAKYLNDMGIKPPESARWAANGIRQILRSPVYTGKIVWNNRVKTDHIKDGVRTSTRDLNPTPIITQGKHPALIDEDTYQQILARLAAADPYRSRRIESIGNTSTFQGLVRCPLCGHHMHTTFNTRPRRTGEPERVFQIRCATANCPTSQCELTVFEDVVLSTLRGWVEHYTAHPVKPAPKRKQRATSTERATLTRELTQLSDQLTNAQNLLERGIYDVDTYLSRQQYINNKKAAIHDRLAALDAADLAAPTITRDEAIYRLLPQLRNVLALYPSSTCAERNALLKTVIDHIDYHKTQRCYRNQNPADYLTIEIFPLVK